LKKLLSSANDKVTFEDPYGKESKVYILSSSDNWKNHLMVYNDMRGCWEIDISFLRHGYQQLGN